MMYRLSFCLCLLFSPTIRDAYSLPNQESPDNLFIQGNAEYQKRDFASAERYYRSILDSGVESGAVYYNLGNTCFKQKKLGEAIYYWEKALQKLPGDADVRENLDLVSLLIVDRIETPPDPLPIRLLIRAYYFDVAAAVSVCRSYRSSFLSIVRILSAADGESRIL